MKRVAILAAIAALATPPETRGARTPRGRAERSGIPVARISAPENVVERASPGEAWVRAAEGGPISIGDRIRTGPDSTVYLEFPWTSVLVGPESTVSLQPSLVLALVLEAGRVEPRAEAGDIIKLLTAEAEIRGKGRVVVRRREGATLVTVLDGRFQVEGSGQAGSLARGEGSVVESGRPPAPPTNLPEPPAHLFPGADPVYAAPGQPVPLSWTSRAASHHIQLLEIDTQRVLLARDVGGPPERIVVPWPGTFRWRVSARNERGLEGLPSADGLICVLQR